MDSEPLQRISASSHLPAIGAPVWVNHPRHDGDTPLHDHDFLELALVTAGRAVHRTIHGESPVIVGDVFVLHPGQWHAYERCSGLQLYNCCIGSGLLASELSWVAHDPYLSCVASPAQPRDLRRQSSASQGVLKIHLTDAELATCTQELERIRNLQVAPTPVQTRAEIIARVLLLMSCIAQRTAATKAVMHAVHKAIPESLVATQRAMELRLDHAWGLQELADLAGISRFQLVRIFRQHLGCPPMVWLIRRRVEKAAVLLLTTDLSMAEVGQRVGWSDANYFSRRFRGAFARSPREYRAQLPLPAIVREKQDWVQWQE